MEGDLSHIDASRGVLLAYAMGLTGNDRAMSDALVASLEPGVVISRLARLYGVPGRTLHRRAGQFRSGVREFLASAADDDHAGRAERAGGGGYRRCA